MKAVWAKQQIQKNVAGNIIVIESISEDKAQEYRSAFFADDFNAATTTKWGKERYALSN